MARKAEDILSGNDPKVELQGNTTDSQRKLVADFLQVMKRADEKKLLSRDKEDLWRRIALTVFADRDFRKAPKRLVRYVAVACAVLFFAVFSTWIFFVWQDSDKMALIEAARNYRDAGIDSAQLSIDGESAFRLENNSTLHFSDSVLMVMDEHGNKKPMQLGQSGDYNKLTVPYGKRMEIVMEEGTKVWVNAGSSLTFPKRFSDDKREVFLEGEAFFEVTPDKDKPFYVYSNDFQVKVLGTSFNLSVYSEDEYSAAVLISGEIEISGIRGHRFQKQLLSPGKTATFNKTEQKLNIANDNVQDHISWTKRQLVLRKTKWLDLEKKLERIYNADINSNGTGSDNDSFSGIIDLNRPLIEVLATIYSEPIYDIQQSERRFIITKRQ